MQGENKLIDAILSSIQDSQIVWAARGGDIDQIKALLKVWKDQDNCDPLLASIFQTKFIMLHTKYKCYTGRQSDQIYFYYYFET